jgi:hypothetical protein
MIEAVRRGESNSLFAGRVSGVPSIEFEMSAAKQVVGFRGGGSVDLLFKDLNGLVNAPGGEELLRRIGGSEGK